MPERMNGRCLIFVAMPLPLIFPIYERYLRGPSVKLRSTNSFHLAAGSALLGSSYIISALPVIETALIWSFILQWGLDGSLLVRRSFRRAVKA